MLRSFVILLSLQVFSAFCFSAEDCLKDVAAPNVCDAYFTVFKWNNKLQKCESAVYGGCNPTKNNFPTMEECQQVAEPICKR
ncbi:kappaPI-actitoxin-Avd3a-like [Anoplophora glabripennis]|uniref:kappaPI-actitoxin-Avd3a-like n=1 Tax=Anoplophora glabripennis TaxID=217634 RepID=UPI000874479D|nr:kappaPI-actitoxin-Avd3a-like [Anoplophora glabripennis]